MWKLIMDHKDAIWLENIEVSWNEPHHEHRSLWTYIDRILNDTAPDQKFEECT
jgi:hypothetical protein